jgi:putative membrane protein
MIIVSKILIALVAIEHVYILYIEMFAWETKGKDTFKSLPSNLFTPTKGLAANQGLYNGFLAAGLLWSLCIDNLNWSSNISIFFLICVIVAGVYGTITASKSIFFKQALPAIIALAFVLSNYFRI